MKIFAYSLIGIGIFSVVLALNKPVDFSPKNTVAKTDDVTILDKDNIPNKTQVTTVENKTAVKLHHLSLSAENTVLLTGEIGPGAQSVADEILSKSKKHKEVYIVIDSPGGSVLDGMQIVSAMQASKVPVYTVCRGMCASMAFIIHQYGTKRLAVDRSVLMAHPASGGLQGTLEQMQVRLSMISRYVDKADAYIAKRNGMTLQQFKLLTNNEYWLDAEDALANKFVDKIVSVSLDAPTPINLFPSNSYINLEWK